MAKHITTTGAFYGFISHGLGQITGMASGLLATVAYVVFEGSLVGGFAYFANDALKTSFGWTSTGCAIALLGTVLIGVLTYFSITLTAAVLSVTLIGEVLLLLALGVSVLVKGGPDGYLFAETVPVLPAFGDLPEHGLRHRRGRRLSAIGIFFAFWSWVGYETTAVYGEESKRPEAHRAPGNPDRGGRPGPVLHVHVVDGHRRQRQGQGRRAASGGAARSTCGRSWSTPTSAGAALGLYKTPGGHRLVRLRDGLPQRRGSRYIYALGRETPLGRRSATPWAAPTRPTARPRRRPGCRRRSPLVLMVLFFFFTAVKAPDASGTKVDTPVLVPYVNAYGLLALIGTAMILIVMTICSVAVIWYYAVKKTHPGNLAHHRGRRRPSAVRA